MGRAGWILLTALGLTVAAFFYTVTLFLVFAMLPSWVAMIADSTKHRYLWKAVAGLNAAGAAPFTLSLLGAGNSTAAVFEILSEPMNIAVLYGSAAFGWLLFTTVPHVVTVFMQMSAQRRVEQLRSQQQRLVAEWGREVTRDAPVAHGHHD